MRKNILLLSAFVLILTGCGNNVPEWDKHITEEVIEVPGLSQDYDLLFLTDTHAIIIEDSDSEQVKENANQRFDNFKNVEGVSSADQMSEWFDYAVDEKFDGVLMGGDIIDYPSEGSLKFLDEQINKLSVPYAYTLGNHDWTFPWEYMTEKGVQEYLPQFNKYMNDNPIVHSTDYGEFIVVALDNSANKVNEAAIDEYERILKLGKPVIALVHLPFLTQSVLTQARDIWPTPVVIGGGNYGGLYPSEACTKFVELTTAEDSPVVAVLAGHVHFYDKDYIDGPKPVIQIVGDAGFHGAATHIKLKAAGTN